ncbi:DUF3168 domain-containing protein [Phenylobacterium terrae]|uniref:DUF3168 domain-containing protein n=1 Tax=Phenylobacterium terrae TaxID=2665495 RepID=A0ABW4NAN4_9CAUL
MNDPSHALQQAIFDALVAANVANAKVYHRVPPATPLPYVQIGQDLITADFAPGEFYECDATVHVFAASMPLVKALVGDAVTTLSKTLTMAGFRCHFGRLERVRYINDSAPDVAAHAVIELLYRVQPEE